MGAAPPFSASGTVLICWSDVLECDVDSRARFPRACRAHDVLFFTAILKKTGIRLG